MCSSANSALNGRVIVVDTLACTRVRERARLTHENYRRASRKTLLAKHSRAIARSRRADNSLPRGSDTCQLRELQCDGIRITSDRLRELRSICNEAIHL